MQTNLKQQEMKKNHKLNIPDVLLLKPDNKITIKMLFKVTFNLD